MQVTDAMAQAAVDRYRALDHNGLTPLPYAMREAVQAALDAMPQATGGVVDGPSVISDRCFSRTSGSAPTAGVTVRMNAPEEITLSAAELPEQLRHAGILGLTIRRGRNASTDEPYVTEDGVDGPGVTDATGSHEIVVNEPRVLWSAYEIATHFGATLHAVQLWMTPDFAAQDFPEPAGWHGANARSFGTPLFDPEEVKAWHEKWKSVIQTIEGDDGRW